MSASTTEAVMEADVAEIVSRHSSLSFDASRNKITCSLTGHEVPGRDLKGLQQYLSGDRYKKAVKWYSRSFESFLLPELLELSSVLVPHKSGSQKVVYCLATKREVNRIPKKIIQHLMSPRFTRAYAKYKAQALKKSSSSAADDGEDMVDENDGEEVDEDDGSDDDEAEVEDGSEDDMGNEYGDHVGASADFRAGGASRSAPSSRRGGPRREEDDDEEEEEEEAMQQPGPVVRPSKSDRMRDRIAGRSAPRGERPGKKRVAFAEPQRPAAQAPGRPGGGGKAARQRAKRARLAGNVFGDMQDDE
jgi:hypothetical protein